MDGIATWLQISVSKLTEKVKDSFRHGMCMPHSKSGGFVELPAWSSAVYIFKLLYYPERKTEELYPNAARAQPGQAVKEDLCTNWLNQELHFRHQNALRVLVTLHCCGKC